MSKFIAAIDQGTTSTRCCVFDHSSLVAMAQREHRQIFPQPGWVEHDPVEIWKCTCEVIAEATCGREIVAVGVTNQRETVVLWDRKTGKPLCNAIVWQDVRTQTICEQLIESVGADSIRAITGLPAATYFSGPKIRWMLDHVPGARTAAERGQACFGTIDSWLIWNLTGGEHVTDVTNASRTLLMNLRTHEWDERMCEALRIPMSILPRVAPSMSDRFGKARTDGPFGAELPITGVIGDQQSALVGQACYEPGESKNTYGTGCFLLLNTGTKPVQSTHGLLTTVAYQFDGQPAVYALEGSVANTGSLVQWLRDELGMIGSANEIETLARSVPDAGGVCIVPAFSGLFAPHWRSDARGIIAGLTRHCTKAHLARAALEATAHQTVDVIEAMRADAGIDLRTLRVDGGMTANDLLMQIQADLLNAEVVLPTISETTALGAAYAAGLGVGYWKDTAELRQNSGVQRRWNPLIGEPERHASRRLWHKAVERSLGWVE